jgi:transposase-like protein
MVMVGDGALGLWRALREVFPATRHQRDWVHYAERRIMWMNVAGVGIAAGRRRLAS